MRMNIMAEKKEHKQGAAINKGVSVESKNNVNETVAAFNDPWDQEELSANPWLATDRFSINKLKNGRIPH